MSNVGISTHETNISNMQRTIANYWLPFFLICWSLFNILPVLAPVFMQVGWTGLGNTIYDIYGLFCHQMAQRSYFLFGEQLMYAPEQLPVELTGQLGTDTFALRAFRGSKTLGWKLAWSDRMVTMYGGFWLTGIVYWLLSKRRRINPLPIWIAVLLMLPLAIDGGTHLISDFVGLAIGFRYSNDWLANLSNHSFSQSFYMGDALGSFNSWMRIITGLLFGIGSAAYAIPFIDWAARRSFFRRSSPNEAPFANAKP